MKLPGRTSEWWDKRPLGKFSDTALSKRYGYSRAIIRFQRELRGIPPYPPLKAVADLLAKEPSGMFSSRQVAERYDVTVEEAREVADLAGYTLNRKYGQTAILKAAIAAGIGVRSDADVGRDLGRTRERIRQLRVKLAMAKPVRTSKARTAWEMWQKGASWAVIAEKLHTKPREARVLVLDWARLHDLPRPERVSVYRFVTMASRGYIWRARGLCWREVAVKLGKPPSHAPGVQSAVRGMAKRRRWPWPPKRKP